MLRCAIWALICCSALGRAAARGQDSQIWDRRIDPQPFEQQPFHQVKVPAWVEDSIGAGYTLSVMDSEARAAAAARGVTLSEMGFVNPFFACYESALIEGRHPDYPPGRVEREIAEYKRLGVRILAVYPPCLQGEVYRKHPEWRRIATDTREIPSIDLEKFPHGGMLCLLGPYGDFFIEVLVEILTRFPDVDAFSFDGLHYGGVCYCAACRDAYRADTRLAIPHEPNLDNAEFRRYQHWADRRIESLIQRMQQRLKAIKPTVALVTWTTNAGRWGHFLSIPRNMPSRMNLLLDAPDQEFWLDETNRGTTIVPALANAYIWATTNHRVAFSEPYLLSHGNPYGKDSFPPAEIERRMLLAATYGAQPSIAVAQPARLQGPLYACMDEIQRRKPWLTHKTPEPWAAIVLSDNTRNFYGRHPARVEERYLANVLGLFRAAVEAHLPVAVINDWNLNDADLARYAALVLPNTACLDDRQIAAIDSYVRGGGGLVATLDTSLFNEFGDARPDFGLTDVLGVRFAGWAKLAAQPANQPLDANFALSIPPDYWEKRKSVFDFRQAADSPLNRGLMKTYIDLDPVTFKGPATRVANTDQQASTWATMHARESDDPAETPAVLARSHGRGRVVYFAAGLDAAYYLYPYPYQRLALAHAIEHVARRAPPVRVDAPMCVHASVMRQRKEGERLIVHLFNDLNSSAHHALPVDDIPMREETVPIYGLGLTFSPDYTIHRVRLQPGDLPLDAESVPAGTRVRVPRLDVHAMVVAELDVAQ
jgi:type 1 glutamine amidotransferase